MITKVPFNQPADGTDAVNSLCRLQDQPFSGNAINRHNGRPPGPGTKQLGPFYEMESAWPAAALNGVALKTLRVSLDDIKSALANR